MKNQKSFSAQTWEQDETKNRFTLWPISVEIVTETNNAIKATTECEDCVNHRMCSSVMVKALQRGWAVFSQTVGFFSAATDVCPVIGEELMCRALAMAKSRVSSLESGPTPAQREVRGQTLGLEYCA